MVGDSLLNLLSDVHSITLHYSFVILFKCTALSTPTSISVTIAGKWPTPHPIKSGVSQNFILYLILLSFSLSLLLTCLFLSSLFYQKPTHTATQHLLMSFGAQLLTFQFKLGQKQCNDCHSKLSSSIWQLNTTVQATVSFSWVSHAFLPLPP